MQVRVLSRVLTKGEIMFTVNENDDTVTLEMSSLEARWLLAVMNQIGGDFQNSPRKYADELHTAFKRAHIYAKFDENTLDENNLLYFNPGETRFKQYV